MVQRVRVPLQGKQSLCVLGKSVNSFPKSVVPLDIQEAEAPYSCLSCTLQRGFMFPCDSHKSPMKQLFLIPLWHWENWGWDVQCVSSSLTAFQVQIQACKIMAGLPPLHAAGAGPEENGADGRICMKSPNWLLVSAPQPVSSSPTLGSGWAPGGKLST